MKVACLITYNDIGTLKGCISSIKGKVDRIIAIDGKFNKFPWDGYYSTDGTLQYLKSEGVEIYKHKNHTEISKRNVYLSKLDPGDTCLVIDGDEEVIGDIPELNCDIGRIEIFERVGTLTNKCLRFDRFFKYRSGYHYSLKHSLIFDKTNNIVTYAEGYNMILTAQVISEFKISHHSFSRNSDRNEAKEKYYEYLRKAEQRL